MSICLYAFTYIHMWICVYACAFACEYVAYLKLCPKNQIKSHQILQLKNGKAGNTNQIQNKDLIY